MRERTSHVGRWAVRLWALAVAVGLGVVANQLATTPTSQQTISQQNYSAADYRYYEVECLALMGTAIVKNGESDPIGSDVDWGEAGEKSEQPDFCSLAAQYRSVAATESSSDAAWKTFYWTAGGVIAVIATLFSTVVALEITRRHSDRELRAYVHIKHPAITNLDSIDKKILTFVVENLGLTPAKECEINFILALEVEGQRDIIATSGESPQPLGAIFPRQEIHVNNVLGDPAIIPESFLYASLYGTITLKGVVDYVDINGKARETYFSFVMSEPESFDATEIGFTIVNPGNDYT